MLERNDGFLKVFKNVMSYRHFVRHYFSYVWQLKYSGCFLWVMWSVVITSAPMTEHCRFRDELLYHRMNINSNYSGCFYNVYAFPCKVYVTGSLSSTYRLPNRGQRSFGQGRNGCQDSMVCRQTSLFRVHKAMEVQGNMYTFVGAHGATEIDKNNDLC